MVAEAAFVMQNAIYKAVIVVSLQSKCQVIFLGVDGEGVGFEDRHKMMGHHPEQWA